MGFGKSSQTYTPAPAQSTTVQETVNQNKGATDVDKMKKKRKDAFGADTSTDMGGLLPNLMGSPDSTLSSGSLLGLSDTLGR